MGRPKPSLPFGDETMLARILRRLGEVVSPVVVAAAPGQQLPAIPTSVTIVRDRQEDRGPLEGLAVALAELTDQVERAFVTTCDVPLLVPDFVRRMIDLAAGYDVAVPHVDGFDEPLAAVYHACVLPQVEALLAADRRRPAFLFEVVRTRRVTADELTDVDPRLDSLFNVNTPADYEVALQRAGLSDFEAED
jgi:molybdopterin-guanine dinucleotide biosynthesis protein A